MKEIIREAAISDIDKGLLKVYIDGYRYHQKGRPDIFTNISDESLREDLVNNFERLSIIVLEVDGTIVGYLAYKIKERHTKKLDIDQLVVHEEFRGKGFGRKLMDEAKTIAIKTNCDRIEFNCWMFNESALAKYEHMGYSKQRIMFEMKL